MRGLKLVTGIAAFCSMLSSNALAQVEFTVDFDAGCAPHTVNATNISHTFWDTTNATFYWFDVSSNPQPTDSTYDFSYTYTIPGSYEMRLIGYDSFMVYMGEWNRNITVSGAAPFSPADSSEFCPNVNINFQYNNFWNSLSWDFGDGMGFQPGSSWMNYTYADTGTYTVTVAVNDMCGDDTVSQTILVYNTATPTPNPSANVMNVCIGDAVNFNAGGLQYAYAWDFGVPIITTDTSSLENPMYAYADTGDYTVILTVTNECGQMGVDSFIISVDTGLFPNAWFNYPGQVCPNIMVNFQPQDPGSYQWTFGNGYTSTDQYPVTYYADTGSYNVQLILTNGCGYVDTNNQVIQVMYDTSMMMGGAQIDFYGNFWMPLDTDTFCIGDPVRFQNNSWSGSQLTYKWYWGDGDSSIVREPAAHMYSGAGVYEVQMILNNSCQNPDTARKWVVIQSSMPPNTAPGFIPMSICPGEVVFFFDDEVDDDYYIYTYNIWYGDGDSSGALTGPSNPEMSFVLDTHMYSDTGTYIVLFTVTNGCGITDSTMDTVYVSNPNMMPFYYNDNSSNNQGGGGPSGQCVNDTVDFFVLGGVSTVWDYGDGSPLDTANPGLHPYAATGTYPVIAYVTNGCGTVDTLLDTAYIINNYIPGGGADVNDMFGCIGDTFNFSRSNWGGGDDGPQNEQFLWTFGDGDSAFTEDASHVYSAGGMYNITFTVTNGCGSSADNWLNIVVDQPEIDESGLLIMDASCGVSDGSITGLDIVSPGQFTFQWEDASQNPVGTDTNLLAQPAGVYTLTVTNQNGCTGTSGPHSIVETGAPSAPTALPPADYCTGDAIADLTATGGGGTIIWYSDAILTDSINNGSPFTSGATTDSTFYVTEKLAGCESPATAVTITVNPVYNIIDAPVTICTGSSVIIYGISQSTANTYYDSLTTVDGCDSIHSTVLSLDPVATVSAGADDVICEGSTYTLSGSFGGAATGLTWTTSGTGSFDSVSLPAATYTPSAADILAGSVTLTATTDDPAGPCGAATDAMTLTINQAATASAGPDVTICEGSTITMAGTFGGGASSILWTTSGTGLFLLDTDPTTIYTPSAADIAAGTVNITITSDDPDGAGPCTAAMDFMVLTINQAATAAAGPDQTICEGSTATMAGSFGGGASLILWTTSGTGTFALVMDPTTVYTPSVADIAAGTVNLTIITDDPDGAGPCTAATDFMVLTINQAATASAGADATICADGCYTLSGSIGGGASTLVWSTSGSGTFDDSTLAVATYCPSAADTVTGSVTLCLTTDDPDGAGPCLAASDCMTLTITPDVGTNAGPDQTVCSDNATATMAGSVSIATGGLWSTMGDGGFASTTDLSTVYTAGTSDVSSGMVTIVLTTTGNGTCTAATDTMMLTINMVDSVSATASICTGDSIQLGGSYQTTAGTYVDIYTNQTGCDSTVSTTLSVVSAILMPLTVDICTGDSIMAGGAYQTTTGVYVDSLIAAGGCDSVVTTTLTVNLVYTTSDVASICNGDSIMLGGAYQFVAGSYVDSLMSMNSCDSVVTTTLTVDPVMTNSLSANICSGDSMMLGGSYQTTAGSYADTYTGANGCDSVVTTMLTIDPLPTIAINPSPGNVCTFGDTVMFTASGASTYTWSPATGLDTTGGSMVNASPGLAQTYTVVGTSTAGCMDSTTVDVQLSVSSPIPAFSSAVTVCEGGSVLYTNTSTDAIAFGWVFAGGTTADTSVQSPTVTYSAAGTYDVSLTAYGCSVDSTLTMTAYITVSPTVTNTDAANICSSDSIMLGGSYTNVAGSYVDTLTTVNGCDSVVTTTLTVEPAVSAGTSASADDCTSNLVPGVDLITILGGTPDAGGTWNDDDGSGALLAGQFSPFLSGAGTFNFTYTVLGTSPCSDDSATVTMTVYAAPTAGTNGTMSACVVATSVDVSTGLGGTPDTNGVWVWTNDNSSGAFSGTIFDPSKAGLGAWTFDYNVPANPGCAAASATVTLNVVSAPNAGTANTSTVCDAPFATVDLNTVIGGTPDAGGTWNDDDGVGFALQGSTFLHNIAGAGSYNFTYVITATGCTNDSATVTIVVIAPPDAGTGNTISTCDTTSSIDVSTGLTGTPGTGGVWSDDSFTGELTNSIFNVSAVGVGTYDFTYTVGAAPCADATATVTVDVTTCVGIVEVDITSFALYPNPSEGRFTLDFGSKNIGDTRIEVFNAIGELLEGVSIENNASKIYVDLRGNPNGLYYINILSDGKLVTNKVSLTK